jgi:hypothetical protein
MTPTLVLALLALPAGADAAPCAVSLTLNRPCADSRSTVPVPYEPQPGDIVLFRSSRIISNVLCHAVLCGGATHSAMVVPRKDGSLALLETPYVGAPVALSEIVPALQKYRGRIWVRRRKAPLTEQQACNLSAFAHEQEGKKYDYCGLLVMPFCRPLQCVTKKNHDVHDVDASSYFCSSLVIAACMAANLLDPRDVRPVCICPNDLMNDWLVDLSCGWEKPEHLMIEACCPGK